MAFDLDKLNKLSNRVSDNIEEFETTIYYILNVIYYDKYKAKVQSEELDDKLQELLEIALKDGKKSIPVKIIYRVILSNDKKKVSAEYELVVNSSILSKGCSEERDAESDDSLTICSCMMDYENGFKDTIREKLKDLGLNIKETNEEYSIHEDKLYEYSNTVCYIKF